MARTLPHPHSRTARQSFRTSRPQPHTACPGPRVLPRPPSPPERLCRGSPPPRPASSGSARKSPLERPRRAVASPSPGRSRCFRRSPPQLFLQIASSLPPLVLLSGFVSLGKATPCRRTGLCPRPDGAPLLIARFLDERLNVRLHEFRGSFAVELRAFSRLVGQMTVRGHRGRTDGSTFRPMLHLFNCHAGRRDPISR